MTTRILSQHGNVVAVDFAPRNEISISVKIHTETLYCDGQVLLTRAIASFNGEPTSAMHFMADLETGEIVTL